METKRNLIDEQLATVKNGFQKNGINLKYIGAGLTLYKSLKAAKERTKNNTSYVKKGIQFKFAWNESDALIEVIDGDPTYWHKWIEQQSIYEVNGFYEDYRPTIHRLDPNGHYEFGNIDVLPYGEHIKENAIETTVAIIKDGKINSLTIDRYESKSEAKKDLNISDKTLNKIQNEICDLVYRDDEGNFIDGEWTAIPMNFVFLEPKSEEEFKQMCIEQKILYRPKKERDALFNKLKQMNEK